jgi:hypothetical protein
MHVQPPFWGDPSGVVLCCNPALPMAADGSSSINLVERFRFSTMAQEIGASRSFKA